jgi:hypothetical protein
MVSGNQKKSKNVFFKLALAGVSIMCIASCTDYNPAHFEGKHNIFAPAGKLLAQRSHHHAVLLKNGEVAILAGTVHDPLEPSDVEKYNPDTKTFRKAGKILGALHNSTANLLTSGKVLIVGGSGKIGENVSTSPPFLKAAELYDPVTETTQVTGSMHFGRFMHKAVALKDGRVLIVGGDADFKTHTPPSLEIYDSKTETFTLWGRLPYFREGSSAVVLENGKVLLTGGTEQSEPDKNGIRQPIASRGADLIDIDKHQVKTLPSMFSTRGGHSMILLKDGKVLIVGGNYIVPPSNEAAIQNTSAEIFDPVIEKFIPLKAPSFTSHVESFLLPNGNVLIFGAHDKRDRSVVIYQVEQRRFVEGPQRLIRRGSMSVAQLKDGNILFTGGYFGWQNGNFDQAEIYQN